MQDSIERELQLEISVERLWELLTRAEHLGAWFGDAGAAVDLRPGGELVLRWHRYGVARGRVEKIEPRRTLSFRWAPFDDPEGDEPRPGNSTLVTFTLAPHEAGALLSVVETGFAELDCAPPQRQRNLEDNRRSWDVELGHLAAYASP